MKALFFSPHTLADSTSGAARSIHTLLEELQRQGHVCRALSSAIVDAPGDLFTRVLSQKPVSATTVTVDGEHFDIPVRRVTIEGIAHTILGDRALDFSELRAFEEAVLRETFNAELAQFDPDVVLAFGGFASNRLAFQQAQALNKKTVIYAVSETYRRASSLENTDVVLTVSHAMGRRLADVSPAPVHVLPPFIATSAVTRAQRTPAYITFINPVPAKGLRLAVALAAECQRLGRPYKFLFVESRGTRASALAACPALADCKNVHFAGNVSDIGLVYDRTKVLLFPSIWFEVGGQTLIEANANGIPALASNIGGIPEMLDGAGFLFDPPAAMREDWIAEPPAAYVQEWVTVLDRLENDSAAMADAVQRAKAADSRYDLGALARRFVAMVRP